MYLFEQKSAALYYQTSKLVLLIMALMKSVTTPTLYWYLTMIQVAYLTMMEVATRFERRQNNAKNDNVVLCKVQMYNEY